MRPQASSVGVVAVLGPEELGYGRVKVNPEFPFLSFFFFFFLRYRLIPHAMATCHPPRKL